MENITINYIISLTSFTNIFLLSISILYTYLYIKYGYYYAKGSSEYARFNNTKGGCEYGIFHKSISNEFNEFLDAFTSYDLLGVIAEFCDVIHSIIKHYILIIFSEKIYCSTLLWSFVFFLILPCTIKLGIRYKKYKCIRNHYNVHNIHHKCNYNYYNNYF